MVGRGASIGGRCCSHRRLLVLLWSVGCAAGGCCKPPPPEPQSTTELQAPSAGASMCGRRSCNPALFVLLAPSAGVCIVWIRSCKQLPQVLQMPSVGASIGRRWSCKRPAGQQRCCKLCCYMPTRSDVGGSHCCCEWRHRGRQLLVGDRDVARGSGDPVFRRRGSPATSGTGCPATTVAHWRSDAGTVLVRASGSAAAPCVGERQSVWFSHFFFGFSVFGERTRVGRGTRRLDGLEPPEDYQRAPSKFSQNKRSIQELGPQTAQQQTQAQSVNE